jgi:hypothetical protein
MYIEIIESVPVKTRPESVDLPTYMHRILMTVRHVFQPSNCGFLTHVIKRNLPHSSHPQALTSPPLFVKTPLKFNAVLTHTHLGSVSVIRQKITIGLNTKETRRL